MIQYLFSNPLLFFIWIAALLVAITVHECAHAWTADRLGDPTARLAGRITLNPLAHLDPIGTLMILFFRFGWGKPVPFDPFNLRNPRRDAALISFAGPAANLILAIALASIIRLAYLIVGPNAYTLEQILTPFIFLAVALGIFNLIPIHPLDGGKILIGLLPQRIAYKWDAFLQRFGFFIILILIIPIFGFSPLFAIILPIINGILALLLPGSPTI
jgi:Zn-dependent protease